MTWLLATVMHIQVPHHMPVVIKHGLPEHHLFIDVFPVIDLHWPRISHVVGASPHPTIKSLSALVVVQACSWHNRLGMLGALLVVVAARLGGWSNERLCCKGYLDQRSWFFSFSNLGELIELCPFVKMVAACGHNDVSESKNGGRTPNSAKHWSTSQADISQRFSPGMVLYTVSALEGQNDRFQCVGLHSKFCSTKCASHIPCDLKHTVFPIGRWYNIDIYVDSMWQSVKTNDIQCWPTLANDWYTVNMNVWYSW